MIDKNEVIKVVEESISGSNLFLVEVTVSKDNEIVVLVDSKDAIDIETCVSLSRKIEEKFDREAEDYELEVGSAGLSSPFKVLAQYEKYLGEEVETLTVGGEKLVGVLSSVDAESFTITITKKVKPEGSKKKVEVAEDICLRYDEVKQTKYSIRFK